MGPMSDTALRCNTVARLPRNPRSLRNGLELGIVTPLSLRARALGPHLATNLNLDFSNNSAPYDNADLNLNFSHNPAPCNNAVAMVLLVDTPGLARCPLIPRINSALLGA
jgi:hypothetical protein